MPAEKLSMRKIKEVLRLKFEAGLANRQIARSCRVNHSTVADYLQRAEAAGLISWPLPVDLDETGLEARLFPPTEARSEPSRSAPNWPAIHEELHDHKHVTLQLLWEEYKQAGARRVSIQPVLRALSAAGGASWIWCCGKSTAPEKSCLSIMRDRLVPVTDPKTGEVTEASIFVAVLGASNYTFAEASWKQDLACWIGSHVRALEFLGGVPAVLVPDNLKTGVRHPCRYEPDLNPTYQEMAAHYGIAVIPARVRKPRDKAKVEGGVLLVERWILAVLRKRSFFSLADLNHAIGELLERLNQRPFRKLDGSRAEWFLKLDRPALRPLPAEPYYFAEWKKARVNIDYHIEVDRHYYSVPYRSGAPPDRRPLYRHDRRGPSRRRTRGQPRPQLQGRWRLPPSKAHRPKSHQGYLEWTPAASGPLGLDNRPLHRRARR